MIKFLPIILIWRDKTINAKELSYLFSPLIYVRKGRTLTIENVGADGDGLFRFNVFGLIPKGNIRIKKKPTEMTAEELRKKVEENKNQENESEKS